MDLVPASDVRSDQSSRPPPKSALDGLWKTGVPFRLATLTWGAHRAPALHDALACFDAAMSSAPVRYLRTPMRRPRISAGWIASATGVSLLVLAAMRPAERASACAMAWDADSAPPSIKGEEALIAWDEHHHVEHFVRSARFEGTPESFAFLVPTPSRPELAEADHRVFRRLARLYTRPPRITRERGRFRGALDAPGAVEVVEERRVAGMDATILAATDAGALEAWLRAHGFAEREALRGWLEPYVARGFFVTAFRYAAREGDALTSTAVRLSFAAERPFYPYAEPRGGARASTRTLRLSVVAPWRAAGREGRRRWRARTGYAARADGLDAVLDGVVPATSRA